MRPGPYTPPLYTAAERAAMRLADAAPDLLAALDRLLLCVAGMDESTLDEDFEAARDAARAAIAKAKGTHEPT